MNFGMFFTEPANGAACPETIEALSAFDISAVIESAIASEDAAGCQEIGHE